MEIEGKTVLVTGGAHRVGAAITRSLSGAGAQVAFTYHTSGDAARELERRLQGAGAAAQAFPCDVADWAAVRALVAQVEARFGAVDIIVNSASLFQATPFPSNDIDTWQRVTRVVIDGAFYVCNAFTPGMQTREQGTIINILDSSVWKPWPNFVAHTTAKGALAAMTRQLALDLAPSIRVNAVVPGPVLPPEQMQQDRQAALAQQTLLKRWGEPGDVAQAVRYLIEADYVTGEILFVDGGERLARV